jgi:hypothetical protein
MNEHGSETVTWTEAGVVQRGQRQSSLSGPRVIRDVVDADKSAVVIPYTDGTERTYHRHEQLPIIRD